MNMAMISGTIITTNLSSVIRQYSFSSKNARDRNLSPPTIFA